MICQQALPAQGTSCPILLLGTQFRLVRLVFEAGGTTSGGWDWCGAPLRCSRVASSAHKVRLGDNGHAEGASSWRSALSVSDAAGVALEIRAFRWPSPRHQAPCAVGCDSETEQVRSEHRRGKVAELPGRWRCLLCLDLPE